MAPLSTRGWLRDRGTLKVPHAIAWGAAAWILASGCTSDAVLGGLHGAEDAAITDSGGRAADTVAVDSPPTLAEAGDTPSGGCHNPTVQVAFAPDSVSRETCSATLAATTFLNALCTCHDATLSDSLRTRGFDSSQSPYDESRRDDSGAAVGVNGSFQMAGDLDIGGSFAIAGQAASTPQLQLGSLRVRGNFRVKSSLLVSGSAQITHNAWLAGDFGAIELAVGEELHHVGKIATLEPTRIDADRIFTETAIAVDPPCPCGTEDILPIGPMIDDAGTRNDDAYVALDPTALQALTGPAALTLPCGRYYLNQIGGHGDLTLQILGKVALFINTSIDLDGDLQVLLTPGAEVDIFVRQNLRVQGHAAWGSQTRPAATRLYVGGTGEIAMDREFVGNLYAPSARVSCNSRTTVWGSIFADDFVSSAATSFVYDRAVTDLGSSCTEVHSAQCSEKCGWCSDGTACVNNVCDKCRSDSDCCSQSVCTNGSCTLLVDIR